MDLAAEHWAVRRKTELSPDGRLWQSASGVLWMIDDRHRSQRCGDEVLGFTCVGGTNDEERLVLSTIYIIYLNMRDIPLPILQHSVLHAHVAHKS